MALEDRLKRIEAAASAQRETPTKTPVQLLVSQMTDEQLHEIVNLPPDCPDEALESIIGPDLLASIIDGDTK